jgi:hypothetical protein
MKLMSPSIDTAEALDQWFENLQNYEATLVSPRVGIAPLWRCLIEWFGFRRIWPPPL